MANKKKDTGYRVALSSAKGMLRLLLYLCGIVLIVYLGKTAYGFGYDVLYQKPVAQSEAKGQDVTVIIKEGTSVYGIGKLLKEKGLLNVGPAVFLVQERLSDYHGELKAGSYILNTYQTSDQMIEIIAGINTEGQPKFDEKEADDASKAKDIEKQHLEGTKEGGE